MSLAIAKKQNIDALKREKAALEDLKRRMMSPPTPSDDEAGPSSRSSKRFTTVDLGDGEQKKEEEKLFNV
jgi:hypothetical protein